MNEKVSEFKNINGFESIAEFLEIPKPELWLMLVKRKKFNYTQFKIPKKNGEFRIIHSPSEKLAESQKRLASVIGHLYASNHTTHGFVAGKSIKTNAQEHVRQSSLLNLDLADFFENISYGRVRAMFGEYFKFNYKDSSTLANLVCHPDGFLPQGAVTSPMISNIICYSLDKEINRLAKRNGCIYTRYADDLTISSKKIVFPRSIAHKNINEGVVLNRQLESIINKNGFSVNASKTRLNTKYECLSVTGVKVNDKLNVNRVFVRRVRSILNSIEKCEGDLISAQKIFDEKYHSRNQGSGNSPNMFEAVRGMIGHIGFIKGEEDLVFIKLADRYNSIINGTSRSGLIKVPLSIEKSRQTYTFVVESNDFIKYKYEEDDGYFICEGGSAFFLKGIGLVTNAHLFGELKDTLKYCENGLIDLVMDEEYYILTHRSRYNAKKMKFRLVAIDFMKDIAILQPENKDAYKYGFEYSCDLKKGDKVVVLGYPEYKANQELRSMVGEILGERSHELETKPAEYAARYEVSATIYSGNSGGPVVNEANEVIGIATKGTTERGQVPNEFVPIVEIVELHKAMITRE
ncbi:trypsin-like serine protease [Listeria booriae]|uniref:reverse transcriptase domain-containing protein n=1 Tax=Listeria booriae TaxID=1552123 RepID=UPI00164DE768|nr:reverse transcriptase domain-containing protein [Listeria booriae]MBC6129345.1 trypsin-like serine protease [Listeria booriae]